MESDKLFEDRFDKNYPFFEEITFDRALVFGKRIVSCKNLGVS